MFQFFALPFKLEDSRPFLLGGQAPVTLNFVISVQASKPLGEHMQGWHLFEISIAHCTTRSGLVVEHIQGQPLYMLDRDNLTPFLPKFCQRAHLAFHCIFASLTDLPHTSYFSLHGFLLCIAVSAVETITLALLRSLVILPL